MTQMDQDYHLAGDDVVVPFAVEALDIRGRAVHVGPTLDRILKQHDYPEDIGFLLGELLVLSVLLGTSLKFDGNFILQTQSDGAVSLSVVDFSTPGFVRAYVRFDNAKLNAAVQDGKASPRELLGNGVMAMTIDQGAHMQRYQGVVALDGNSLEAVAHQYFRQSEQIPTKVRLSVAQVLKPHPETGEVEKSWRAGGVLTQFLPEASERITVRDLPSGRDDDELELPEDEAWIEASALIDTVSDDELSDPNLGVERLLYRLFHESGVRAFTGVQIQERCTCSREKVISLIKSFAEDPEKPDISEEGYETKCEFCGTIYNIGLDEL